MEPSTLEELTILADVSAAKSILLEARIDALQSFLGLLFKRAGVDSVGGTPFEEILIGVVRERVQQRMIALEASDPGVAANLQRILDEIAKSSGSPPSDVS